MLKIAIFSEFSEGGIADYAHDQANALAARGLDVEVLCSPAFVDGRQIAYKARPILRDPLPRKKHSYAIMRKLRLAATILHNERKLYAYLAERKPDAVLTHFSEYLAPLWVWRRRRLRRTGIAFYSVLHDPVRNYRVGPRWWHEWSVREAFSALDTVFVHTTNRL